MVELENVKKIYKLGNVDVYAIKGISLKIYDGEFLAIVGKSGSGKSTCLNLIGCLDKPTSGRIKVLGKDISQFSENEIAKIRGKTIGFVFQMFNLIPTLNTIENIMLPMIFQGVKKEERMKKVKEIIKLVGLENRMLHKPNELSGGERQRVAIARALVNEPKIILADEPTGNLDSKSGKVIIDLLIKINKERGTTLVVVTHDIELASLAERIIKLEDGRIVEEKIRR
ncbi:MAG: ABC transporter ATP-binding protein [Candidatus Aenigmarchaeota archaeon]|nr:ABC transporter ATP-binding protein [Candidatus Aenigmarchaeota archaeon]